VTSGEARGGLGCPRFFSPGGRRAAALLGVLVGAIALSVFSSRLAAGQPTWQRGVRLVEILPEALEVPPPPPTRTLLSLPALPGALGADAIGVPFSVEAERPFIVRLKLGSTNGPHATAQLYALSPAEAAAFGEKPAPIVAEPPGERLGACIEQAHASSGVVECQRADELEARHGAALLVIRSPDLGAGDLVVLDHGFIEHRAPRSPLLGPLVRHAILKTAHGFSHRTGLSARPGGRYVFPIDLPRDAKLLLSLAHEPGKEGAPVRFRVFQQGRTLLDEVVPPDRRIRDRVLPLEGTPGERVLLTLQADAVPGAPGVPRGLWLAPRVRGSGTAPHILLITLDAVRADHLSAYGYPRDTSPVLERFAKEGTLFERATAQAGNTWLSVASLLSGRYPVHSGVRRTGDLPPPELPLLADLLAARGYETLSRGVSHLTPALLSSFDDTELVDSPKTSEGENKRDLMARSVAQVRALMGSLRHPTFIWVHLPAAHYPLYPAEPLRYNLGYEGRFATGFSPEDHRLSATDITNAEGAQVIALYDAECREADAAVGQMLDALEESGNRDGTIVVVTADHGELIGKRKVVVDHNSPFDAVLHVPLAISFRGRLAPQSRVLQRVQLIDLVPTLLSLAGLPPASGLDGRDLSEALRGGTLEDRPAYAEPYVGVYSRHAGDEHLLTNRKKTVITFGDRPATPLIVRVRELYDLSTDPSENHDLSGREPARADAAEAALEKEIARWGAPLEHLEVPSLGQDTLDVLRQAGYLQHDPAEPIKRSQR
jgi:arylsulfatase A-like enzyme